MFKKNILVCENYIDENGVEWYNVKYLKLFAKESKFMKKMRILALVIAILSVAAMLFLVSCKDDAGKKGDCSVTGEHRWNAWKSNGDATCTEDGTKSRRCPICKEQETVKDEGTATGHYFLTYVLNDDATCTEDGTETSTCTLCYTEKVTRPAENSALGHRYGTTPVESYNGFNVFECVRNCGHREIFDNGTIDEDFERDETIEDNTKRYFTPGAVTELVTGENSKYLMIKRGDGKIIGDTSFGIYMTPDYDLYKSKDYVVSFDMLITENTRDLILLEGKKVSTKQVFATYDSESGKIMVNGVAAYTVKKGEWFNLAFVLDDPKGEFDVYVNNSLVISKATYDKKDTYYISADMEYLCIRMIAEPKVASEFGLDNIKTYVGKTVTNPAEPSVKENITSTLAVPTDIMGPVNPEWFEKHQKDNNLSDAVMEKSYVYSQIMKDGKLVDVVTWQNFKSGNAYFDIKTFEGLESYVITENDKATFPNIDYTTNPSSTVYDLSDYDSVTITFYCDTTSEELAAAGLDGYKMLIAFNCPSVVEGTALNKASYFQGYYTFTAEDVLNGEDGWKTVTIPFSDFGVSCKADWKAITFFRISARGWASGGVGLGTTDSTNFIDGTVVKIQNISFNKDASVTHAKLAEDCTHKFDEVRTVAPTCITPGFDVKICTECGGEQPDATNFVPALGHNYVTIQDIEATCTENGYHSEVCKNCNDKNRTERFATGHIESTAEGYAPEVIAPTCFSTGITKRTCGKCGTVYETDPTPIIGHVWGEGEVTTPANCTDEGVMTYKCTLNGENGCDGVKTEVIPATGHTPEEPKEEDYVPATCVKGAYTPTRCADCQVKLEIADEENPALGHEMVPDAEAAGNKAPTCYEAGAAVEKCSRCDYTEIKEIPTTEHNYDYNNGTVTKEPTCTEKGEKSYACLNENCTIPSIEEMDIVPHTEVTLADDPMYEPKVTAPTCTEKGFTTRKCKVCNAEYTDTVIEAIGSHNDGGNEHEVQVGNCLIDSYDRYTCTVCNEVVYVTNVPAVGAHTYERVIDDEDKALRDICSVCGDKQDPTVDKMPNYTDMLKALGDDKRTVYAYMELGQFEVGKTVEGSGTGMNYKFNGQDNVTFVVRNNKVVIGNNNGKDGVNQYVSTYNLLPGLTNAHSYVNIFLNKGVSTAKGGKLVFEFSLRLGEPGADGKYQASDFSLGDRGTTAQATKADIWPAFAKMTTSGAMSFVGTSNIKSIQFTKDKFTHVAFAFNLAENKMDIYVDGVLVEMGAGIFAADAYTMAEYQVDEIRMLQRDAANGLGSWYDLANVAIYTGDAPVAILGVNYCAIKGTTHEEDLEAVVVTPPTCVTDGYTTHICANCGGTWVDTVVPATGHTEKELGEEYAPKVVEPTCSAEGYTERECSVCGEKYINEEDIVPTLEHTFLETPDEDSVAPGCLTTGTNKFTCTAEGCGFVKTETVDALGHTPTTEEGFVPTVIAPTCTDGGYTIVKCGVCGINYKTDELPANDHKFGEAEVVLEPTCTEKGKSAKYCENCPWASYEEIAALGHKYVIDAEHEETFAATCYADGSNHFTCSVCFAEKVEAVTERPAHTWSEYEVEVPATCTTTGKDIRHCTVDGCEATSDKVSQKLGHDLDEGVATVEPTCTEAGVLTKSCKRDGCDYTEESDIEALGHDLVLDPENNTYNCTTDGKLAYKCQREGCGYTYTEDKLATGHKFAPDQGESDWVVITPATCTGPGLKYRPCLNDGCDAKSHIDGDDNEKALAVILQLPHEYGEELLTKEPTTEEEGYTYYKCVNCGHENVQSTIPAITTGTSGFVWEHIGDGWYITGFENEDVTEIVIPATYKGEAVIGIDPSIFADDACGITGVTIESSDLFASGDYGIFAGCTLDYVVIKAGVEVPDGCFDGAVIGTIYLEDGASISDIDWGTFEYGDIVNGPKPEEE